MPNREVEQIVEAFLNRKHEMEKPSLKVIADGAMKVLIALSSAAILALFSSVSSFKSEIIILSERQANQSVMIERLQDKIDTFTTLPRFTKEDFYIEMAPLKRDVERNSSTLSERTKFMEEVRDRLSTLEAKVKMSSSSNKSNN